MSYAPLDDGFIHSTTFRMGPIHAAVWAAILSSKDEMGVTSLSPVTLALIWKIDESILQKVWDELATADPKSKSREYEGRRMVPTDDGRWLVTGHVKYRDKHQVQRRRDQVAAATRKWRENALANRIARVALAEVK